MKLAVVTGYVVCTVRHEGLAHDKLLMVEMLNARGEWVLLVSGSSARQAHAHGASPVDLCVIGIVDEAAADGQVLFHK